MCKSYVPCTSRMSKEKFMQGIFFEAKLRFRVRMFSESDVDVMCSGGNCQSVDRVGVMYILRLSN